MGSLIKLITLLLLVSLLASCSEQEELFSKAWAATNLDEEHSIYNEILENPFSNERAKNNARAGIDKVKRKKTIEISRIRVKETNIAQNYVDIFEKINMRPTSNKDVLRGQMLSDINIELTGIKYLTVYYFNSSKIEVQISTTEGNNNSVCLNIASSNGNLDPFASTCEEIKNHEVKELINKGLIFRIYREGDSFFITQVRDINENILLNLNL